METPLIERENFANICNGFLFLFKFNDSANARSDNAAPVNKERGIDTEGLSLP